jgi:hypothetical protein
MYMTRVGAGVQEFAQQSRVEEKKVGAGADASGVHSSFARQDRGVNEFKHIVVRYRDYPKRVMIRCRKLSATGCDTA